MDVRGNTAKKFRNDEYPDGYETRKRLNANAIKQENEYGKYSPN